VYENIKGMIERVVILVCPIKNSLFALSAKVQMGEVQDEGVWFFVG
jgi:hypothetical protein